MVPDETIARDDLFVLRHRHCTACGRPGRHDTQVGIWHILDAMPRAYAFVWCAHCRQQPGAADRFDATMRQRYGLPAKET